MQIFFAAEILVIRLAKTYYLDEFQTCLVQVNCMQSKPSAEPIYGKWDCQ